ncbi:MAG: hypothetical protein KF890_13865 [Nitrospira sp.]|nr:hypothetical protein [Nitrospira sp.]
MRKALRFILACVLLAPLFTLAGWIDREGKPLPDAPDRKSIGDFGAWLVLTDKESEAFSRWDTPSEGVYLSSRDKIERGNILTALVMFSGCGTDKNGNCDLVVKFKVVRPDGRTYADLPYQEAWVDKPVPRNKSLGMSVGYIRVIIEPGEPLGKYKVYANVRDKNLNKTIELLSVFESVEKNTQHNKPIKPTP